MLMQHGRMIRGEKKARIIPNGTTIIERKGNYGDVLKAKIIDVSQKRLMGGLLQTVILEDERGEGQILTGIKHAVPFDSLRVGQNVELRLVKLNGPTRDGWMIARILA